MARFTSHPSRLPWCCCCWPENCKRMACLLNEYNNIQWQGICGSPSPLFYVLMSPWSCISAKYGKRVLIAELCQFHGLIGKFSIQHTHNVISVCLHTLYLPTRSIKFQLIAIVHPLPPTISYHHLV